MKKAILLFIFFLTISSLLQEANAQDAFSMSTQFFQNGAPKYASKETHYGDLDGTPCFFDGWSKGAAKLSDGTAYKDLYLRYDEILGMVTFKYALADSGLMFSVPAVEFVFSFINHDKINNVHFLSGFEPIDGATTASFYQVIAEGNTKVLKRTVKHITRIQQYASTEIKQSVVSSTDYYLAKGKKPIAIKNSNKAILAALSDKADLVKQYIADNSLNAKNDDDFAKIVNYYNAK